MTSEELRIFLRLNPLPDGTSPNVENLQDLKASMRDYAAAGARFGTRRHYWAVWKALSEFGRMTLPEALASLPPRGYRWFALWAQQHGDTETFLQAYELHLRLRHPDKIGPIAHENAIFFAELFRRSNIDLVVRVALELFRNERIKPGLPGYLYENVWLTMALAAQGKDEDARAQAEKLLTQFPTEGGAWVAMAVAVRRTDPEASKEALKCAKGALFIDEAVLAEAKKAFGLSTDLSG